MAVCVFHSDFSLKLFVELLSLSFTEYNFVKEDFVIAK